MESGYRSHVAATVATALQHLADVREVALSGKAADGTVYTPLPEPDRDQVVATVDRISALLSAAAAQVAPEEAAGMGKRKPLGATHMWLSTLLYMVLEQVEDLQPERMARRYGAQLDQEGADLAETVSAAASLLRRALEGL